MSELIRIQGGAIKEREEQLRNGGFYAFELFYKDDDTPVGVIDDTRVYLMENELRIRKNK